MLIKGFQGVSTLDFPSRIASIIFTAGCNYHCPYCYNTALCRNAPELPKIEKEELFAVIDARKKFIDGIVITGGEPTIHEGLISFILDFRQAFPELEIKLDTNGSNPQVVEQLLDEKVLDYLAMDFKLPLTRYSEITSVPDIAEKFLQTRDLLRNSELDYEFRTTMAQNFVTLQDMECIANEIQENEKWFWQNFAPLGETLQPDFSGHPYSDATLTKWMQLFPKHKIKIR